MIALFVLKLSAGITLMWWLMPRTEVTDGFFRIQMRVVLGLSVLIALLLSSGSSVNATASSVAHTTLTAWPADSATVAQKLGLNVEEITQRLKNLAILGAVVSYVGSIVWALGRRRPGNICINLLAVCGMISLVMQAMNVSQPPQLPLQLLASISSAALLGSVTTGMLLGHWYLTTPTMSIRPLHWFNQAIILATVLKFIASGWALNIPGHELTELTQQIWLSIRWLCGIAGPAAAAFMVWRILKHRNTQSATGVLFAALILVFMGEMASALLEADTSVPW